jgi:hypothetical protein
MHHFLKIAHELMYRDNLGHLWTPGSTTWRHYTTVSESTITRAQRDGYLSTHTGIPYLISKGYNQF